METYPLICHPDTPAAGVRAVAASIACRPDGWVEVRWRIEGAGALNVPPFAGSARADNLWQTTCFEVFLRGPGDERYVELNFSPSERWAAYDFSAYRTGMADRPMPRGPVCTMRRGQGTLALFDVAVPQAALPALPQQLSITAVIEEQCGTKSYWALAHPGGKPDFHHPACFAAMLAAPSAP